MFSLIEDSGYLPRMALLVDRLFKCLGLSGRAVIPPLTLGLGCATMGTLRNADPGDYQGARYCHLAASTGGALFGSTGSDSVVAVWTTYRLGHLGRVCTLGVYYGRLPDGASIAR